MTFLGSEVRPGSSAMVDVRKGYGMFITGATLVDAPKKPQSRVCIELFNPAMPSVSVPAGVLCENTGMFNCTMKSLFTQAFGIRLSGASIQGAKVHVFGSQLPYNSAVFDDELMQEMEAQGVEFPKAEESVVAEADEGESKAKSAAASKKRKAEAAQADVKAEEAETSGAVPSKKKKKERHSAAKQENAEAKKLSGAEKTAAQKKDDGATKQAGDKLKGGAKQQGGAEEKAGSKKKADGKEGKVGAKNESTDNKKKSNDGKAKGESSKAPAKRTKTLKNGVQITEVMEGTGKPVKAGRNVAVQYKLSLKNGKVVDKSTKNGFKFRLGVGECIPGFDAGVLGMREGGERHVVVPSDMGYGPKGAKPAVPPNATLLFDVKVTKAW